MDFKQANLASIFLVLFAFAATAQADFLIYAVPGTDLQFVISGKVSVNAGGTVTVRHTRGSLHFPIADVARIEAPSAQEAFQKNYRKATSEGTVKAYMNVAREALHQGLLDRCRESLSEAWKADSNSPEIQRLASAMSFFKRPCEENDEDIRQMRAFLKRDDLKVQRSAHFILMHDLSDDVDRVTRKTSAVRRLELLEKVYESFFLDFALGGKYIRPPSRPLRVVTFAKHGDYLLFVNQLSPTLKNASGFYDPKENIAIFYDQKSDESYRGIDNLMKQLDGLRAQAKRDRSSGDLIRFVNSLELLIEIAKEDQDIEVLTHECTHQLAANANLIPRDSLFVRWTHEGLAAYFESPKEATWSGIGAVNEQRLAYYRMLSEDREHGSIEFLVTDRVFDYAANQGAVLAAYGQAWALTHFLMTTRFSQLMDYYDRLAKLPKTDNWGPREQQLLLETFDGVFGDRQKLEYEWRRYMSGLRTEMEKLAELE